VNKSLIIRWCHGQINGIISNFKRSELAKANLWQMCYLKRDRETDAFYVRETIRLKINISVAAVFLKSISLVFFVGPR
jgi:hypothetical protein